MILPDYKNSIVNLVSTLTKSMGDKPKYKPLKQLNCEKIGKYKNIIFLFIDGLGYDYLFDVGKDSFMSKHVKGKITSIFPSTTAACATTYITGVPVQQHASVGWSIFLKEVGMIVDILPFIPSIGGLSLSDVGINPKLIYDQKSIFEKINRKSYAVYPNFIKDSDFNNIYMKNLKKEGFNTPRGMFNKIRKTLKKPGKKFIFSYWHGLDTICHGTGTKSKESINHFMQLDKLTKNLSNYIKETNTILIISSDHGHIDISEKKWIIIDEHPKLKECLTMPLTGGNRYAYCYVRPDKVKQFKNYVKKNLKHCCLLKKSSKLVKQKYFGQYKPNPKLYDRLGDYMLIMKENYALIQEKPNSDIHLKLSLHGGTTKEEMYVPVIVVDGKK